VHDRRSSLIVFTIGGPHLLEGAVRRQDGTANPNRVYDEKQCMYDEKILFKTFLIYVCSIPFLCIDDKRYSVLVVAEKID
jgi:hypothetical protein